MAPTGVFLDSLAGAKTRGDYQGFSIIPTICDANR